LPRSEGKCVRALVVDFTPCLQQSGVKLPIKKVPTINAIPESAESKLPFVLKNKFIFHFNKNIFLRFGLYNNK